MEQFVSGMLEYGAMGLFALFLVWQHFAMQKRLDQMTREAKDERDAMRSEQKQELSATRDFYERKFNDLTLAFNNSLQEIDKDTDEILDILKEQQQEKKLKEIAKRMAVEEKS